MTHHATTQATLAFTSCGFDDLFEMVEAPLHPAHSHSADLTLPDALTHYFELQAS